MPQYSLQKFQHHGSAAVSNPCHAPAALSSTANRPHTREPETSLSPDAHPTRLRAPTVVAGCSATAWLSMPARALVYEYRIASPGCTVGESSSFVEPFLRPDASGGGTTFSLFGSSTFFTPISVGVGGAPSDRVGCGARVPCGASIPGSRSPITMPTKSQQNPEPRNWAPK